MYDFLFVIIELLSLALTVETIQTEICRRERFLKAVAGRFFGLVTKHTCDRRTDRQTDRQTDGQNYDSQDRASIAASRGKN